MHLSVAKLREIGLLGKNILGTGLNFDLEIKEGAGAFVCGEETAMIASIEGKRGTPRTRPPFPVHSGLWGKSTTINNVETLANIPPIFLKGWEWFAALGTEKSKGTKVFALAGKVNNTGLVEVPMGATLREIVYDVGGGIPRGRKFKAAQTGGPSGGCVPAKFMDLPLDYESLKQVGAIMGSGGLIIMDEGTCMVDMARYFLDFTQKESCGKCTPCRLGTKRMLEILERICNGQGREGDIETLEEIARTVTAHSLCALGKTAPNPVLSTLRYFREEYEEHIRLHHCRAAVCEAMVKAPCTHLCPANINVPEYISLVALGKYQRAEDLIRRRNPFASICGRVCHHPCETLCRRGDLDEAIAIMELKRVATDNGKRSAALIKQLKASPTGKKVAVIGAGPGGLSAGYFLSLMGHKVTVYEADAKAGGMIRTGIPEFRMPSDVLDDEIEFIKKSGLKLLTSTPVDAALFAKLQKQNDAIFISVGSHFGAGVVSPEESVGILEGFDFLRRAKAGEKFNLGKNVVIITGCECPRSAWCDTAGTTAVDSARTALRLGATEVSVLYRRDRDELPSCAPGEFEEAVEEGVRFVFLAGTKKINRNGRVASVECVRFKLGELDNFGKRKTERIEGSEFTLPADTIIRAAGQERSIYNFLVNCGVKLNKWALLETESHSLMTAAPGIFAGGDCITGHGTVVGAVGAGQRAAVEIDRYLGGKGQLPANSDPLVANLCSTEEGSALRARPPRADGCQRAKNFTEVTGCFDKQAAACEAKRCLRCDLEEYAHEKV
jgi:NADH-quinone oxidoreductase subunit F